MTTPTDHTFVFADDGSPACDVAWLWICNHRWGGWQLDVMTARTPEFPYRPDPARDRPEPWEPPRRRIEPNSARYVTSLLAPTRGR